MQSLKICEIQDLGQYSKKIRLLKPDDVYSINRVGIDHELFGQKCMPKGSCDYGLYPLQSRYYMDQIPLDLFQSDNRSLNPVGIGYCRITGTDKKMTKRRFTVQL